MRVLLVHDEPIEGGYGAESYLRRLAHGLREAGDDVAVMAGDVRHTGLGRGLDLWDPRAAALVARRARQHGAEIVNLHSVNRELSPSVVRRVNDARTVMTVHDLRLLGAREHSPVSPRGAVEWMGSALTRRRARFHADAIIGVSSVVTDALRASGFSPVATVGVPAPDPAVAPRPVQDCRDVVVAARLDPDKGVDIAIAAFTRIAADHPDSRLLIAGDGSQRSALMAAAEPLGRQVDFVGRLGERDLSMLLGAARLVVVASMPSRRPEGSSLAAVEAARHGRPVVCTDDPAVAAVTGRLNNALVVPAGDAAAMAAAIDSLLGDAHPASELGATGARNAQQLHSVAAVTAATRAVYLDVLGRAA